MVSEALLIRLENLVNHGEDQNEAFDEFLVSIPLLIVEIRRLIAEIRRLKNQLKEAYSRIDGGIE